MANGKTSDTPTTAPEGTAAGSAPAGDDARRLQEDLDSLRRDLSQLTTTVRDIASARRDQGMAAARDYADKAYGQAQEARAQAEQTIAANPLLSVATAFGIGYVLGRVLGDK